MRTSSTIWSILRGALAGILSLGMLGLTAVLAPTPVGAAPGDLVDGYGAGSPFGATYTGTLFGDEVEVADADSLPDGSTLLVVESDDSLEAGVVKLGPDGLLDTSFGGGAGEVSVPWSSEGGYFTALIDAAPDGSFVVASEVLGESEAVIVRRYDAAGNFAWQQQPLVPGFVMDAAIDRQDRVVLVAMDFSGRLVVYRFLNGGALDSTFSGDGVLLVDTAPTSFWTADPRAHLAIDAFDGLMIAADAGEDDPFVISIFESGAMNTFFGSGGIARPAIETPGDDVEIHDIALDDLGRPVLAGAVCTDRVAGACQEASAMAARLTNRGAVDMSFSDDGRADIATIGSGSLAAVSFASSIAPTDGDRLVVGSEECNVARTDGTTYVRALTDDGSMDVDFGPSGSVALSSGCRSTLGRATLPQVATSGGRVLVATQGVADGDATFVVSAVDAPGNRLIGVFQGVRVTTSCNAEVASLVFTNLSEEEKTVENMASDAGPVSLQPLAVVELRTPDTQEILESTPAQLVQGLTPFEIDGLATPDIVAGPCPWGSTIAMYETEMTASCDGGEPVIDFEAGAVDFVSIFIEDVLVTTLNGAPPKVDSYRADSSDGVLDGETIELRVETGDGAATAPFFLTVGPCDPASTTIHGVVFTPGCDGAFAVLHYVNTTDEFRFISIANDLGGIGSETPPAAEGVFSEEFDIVAQGENEVILPYDGGGSATIVAGPCPPTTDLGGGFTGLTPARLLDSRLAGQGPCVSGASGRALTVAGVGGVPADAAAVALNVTVTGASTGGFVTVFPNGESRPTAANLNYVKGQTVPNMVIAKVGANGQVRLFASNGCPHMIVDVAGWFEGGAPGPGGFTGLTPARLLDSRLAGQGPCVSGASGRALTVAGVGGVPADAAAVALNVTVTGASTGGFVTVFPNGESRPTAANLNYVKGQTVPNMVIAKVGANGQVRLFASNGCPHMIVDVAGWFEGGAPGPGGFTGLTPARLLDSRLAGQGPCVSGASGRALTVAGVGGVPADAAAVALNVTVTGGFVTVFPNGESRPTAANLNYVKGQTVPNMVIAKVGANGQVRLFASNGCPHMIVDVAGWFEAA